MMNAVFSHLAGHQYMQLVTFRKNGEQVPTQVWFAEQDGKLYVMTAGDSGKLKRIRANGRAMVGPCDARGRMLGELVEAHGRVLPSDQQTLVEGLLSRKYGLVKRLFDIFGRFTGSHRRRAYLEISSTTPQG